MAVCLQKTETMEAEEKRQKKTFIDSSEFSPFQQGRIIKMIKIDSISTLDPIDIGS